MGLRQHFCTQGDSASAAIWLMACREQPSGRATGIHQAMHCAAFTPTASSPQKSPLRPVSWRDGTRSLYCRSLARSVSDLLFSAWTPAGMCDLSGNPGASAQAVLPNSWLQAGLMPAPNIERMREGIVKHFDAAGFTEGTNRTHASSQCVILAKAA